MSLAIGITGGIGTGKTTIAKIFAAVDIPVLNTDIVSKKLIREDVKLQKEIAKQFGQDVFINGILQSKVLAARAFVDKETTALLNQIVHPAVLAYVDRWHLVQKNVPYTVRESALMIESGSYKKCDYLIGVIAPEAIRILRVMQREHCTEDEVRKRMALQMPEAEKAIFYDFEIINDNQQKIIEQVLNIHHKLLSLALG